MSVPDRCAVTSADGTRISYVTVGERGDGVVVVGGVLRTAEDYLPLAHALADRFTMHVIDRRGRGGSGPLGDEYSIEHECADLQAVCAATGATRVFGHSYGGLIALQAAQRTSWLTHVAAYEPGLATAGAVRLQWVPRYRELLAAGDRRGAFATMVRGSGHAPRALSRMPLAASKLVLRLAIPTSEWRRMEPLLDANLREHEQIEAHETSRVTHAAIRARVLLLAGTETPAFAVRPLVELAQTIPEARLEMIPGVAHNAPDQAAPGQVAPHLRRFFDTSDH